MSPRLAVGFGAVVSIGCAIYILLTGRRLLAGAQTGMQTFGGATLMTLGAVMLLAGAVSAYVCLRRMKR